MDGGQAEPKKIKLLDENHLRQGGGLLEFPVKSRDGATSLGGHVHQAPIFVGGEEVTIWTGGETLGFLLPGELVCRVLWLH